MAATSGLGALTGNNLAQDLLNHITSATTTATAITVTGPTKCALLIATVNNTDTWSSGGTKECNDANYARQSITWNAAATTTGQGYNVGYVSRTNNGALTFGTGAGFAVTQTITGIALLSSDATPIQIAYQNFAASQTVNAGNQYQVNSGSLVFALS